VAQLPFLARTSIQRHRIAQIPERPYTGPWNAPTCLYFNCVFMPDAEPIPFVINSLSGSPISVNEHRLWANDYQKYVDRSTVFFQSFIRLY
jgi:hypothetical protein